MDTWNTEMEPVCERRIPVLAFSAYSGTGKTTLIEKLIPKLKAQNLRVGVIKHDAHRFEIDREGKDSWRFTHAGADITILSSEEKCALIETRYRSFAELLSEMHDVDLILVEGYRNENVPQIGICREASGKCLPDSPERYAAIVTDVPMPDCRTPVFGLEDIDGILAFLLDFCGLRPEKTELLGFGGDAVNAASVPVEGGNLPVKTE